MAFFPVSLNLVGRHCVVIGEASDREAIDKEAALRESGADVRWIQDPAALRDEDVTDAYLIISTPQGIMSGKRAKKQGVGGEVLAYVW